MKEHSDPEAQIAMNDVKCVTRNDAADSRRVALERCAFLWCVYWSLFDYPMPFKVKTEHLVPDCLVLGGCVDAAPGWKTFVDIHYYSAACFAWGPPFINLAGVKFNLVGKTAGEVYAWNAVYFLIWAVMMPLGAFWLYWKKHN